MSAIRDKYTIDTDLLAIRLLSFMSRATFMAAFVKLLLFPLKYINAVFVDYMEVTVRDISTNSQIIVLQAALNLKYLGSVSPSVILVQDSNEQIPEWYGYYKSETNPPLGYGYYTSEHQPALGYGYYAREYDTIIDFYVVIPAYLGYSDVQKQELLNYVNKYKLADKKAAIKVI